MNFLTSSVVKAEEPGDFAELQLAHIRAFRAHHRDGERARVSQGLVVIPTDTASPEQRRKYEEFARIWPPGSARPSAGSRPLAPRPELAPSRAPARGGH